MKPKWIKLLSKILPPVNIRKQFPKPRLSNFCSIQVLTSLPMQCNAVKIEYRIKFNCNGTFQCSRALIIMTSFS